jgi:hypothetical protein
LEEAKKICDGAHFCVEGCEACEDNEYCDFRESEEGMERLTIRSDICCEPENNIVYSNPNDPEGMYNILDLAECLYNGGEAEAGILLDISNRLAAYEDTGLTPAQVEAMKMDMEQLRADNINAEMNLAHMTADKDEQARKTRQLEEGLRSTLKVLETLNYRGGLGLDIHKWLRDEMQTVNALLGGKEDGSSKDK